MPIFQQYLFAIGAFQGLLLSCLLFLGPQGTTANRVLSGWCLLLAMSFLSAFITLNSELNPFSSLIGWSYFFPASYGAFLYLYCRHAMSDQALAPRDCWHIAPIGICYLLNIDILFSSPEVKLEFMLTKPPESISFFMAELIMYFQAFIYLGLSIALIRRYHNSARSTLSSFNPGTFNWLRNLTILYAVIWSLKIIPSAISGVSVLSHIGNGLIVILIYSIAMAQWRNPTLFRIEQLSIATPKQTQPEPTEQRNAESEPLSSSNSKTAGALDDSIRSKLLETTKNHMLEHQTFRDKQLTLTSLATAIGVSTHHLSEALNQKEGKNFYQFVNKYRVDYICECIKADQTVTVLELAMNAGFSSKSTFNTVFKQFTGRTPSQYRKDLLK